MTLEQQHSSEHEDWCACRRCAAFVAHVERVLPEIELGTYPGVELQPLLQYLRSADHLVTIARDRRIVAHAEVHRQAHGPHRAIASAAVERGYWGRGLGSDALGQVLRWCDANDVDWVDGWRWADNERAARMDHALGFVDAYTIKDAWRSAQGLSRDQVIMVRAKGAGRWPQAQQ